MGSSLVIDRLGEFALVCTPHPPPTPQHLARYCGGDNPVINPVNHIYTYIHKFIYIKELLFRYLSNSSPSSPASSLDLFTIPTITGVPLLIPDSHSQLSTSPTQSQDSAI